MITFQAVTLTDKITAELIRLSQDWEAEKSCYGYRANGWDDIEGNRLFTTEENGERKRLCGTCSDLWKTSRWKNLPGG